MVYLNTPISREDISLLKVGEIVSISGQILCGRDAVLPKIVKLYEEGKLKNNDISLEGMVIFHTAVSPAGIGPTSSNKLEIEGSIPKLSEAGVRIHLGKGALSSHTITALKDNCSAYAVIPPVTALLERKTAERKVLAFPELGMEALYMINVEDVQVIIAAVNGNSIYG